MAGMTTPEARPPMSIEAPVGPDSLDACWRSWVDAGRPTCPRRGEGGSMLDAMHNDYMTARSGDFGPAGGHSRRQ